MAAYKLILCASNHQLTAGVWSGTRLQFYSTFLNDEEGHAAFQVFIKKHQSLKVYLIADAVEEEYRLETLPHITGKAKKELLERKLNQFNRNNLFRTAHFINQDKDKRRDDNYLFVALTKAEFIQDWMRILQVNQVPLVGLYLLPMISQYVVQQMKLGDPNILLCERLSSGLRQTYLSDGHLRMSRMVPMTDVKPSQLAYFYLVEIEKTRLYLLSQRFISDNTELQLVIPSLDSESDTIGKSISQEQGMECRIVDSLAYAKNSNIDPDLIKDHPELLHMQLLANGNVPDNLAPEELTKSYQIYNLKKAINITTVITGLLGLLMIGYSMLKAGSEIAEKEFALQQTSAQEQRYQTVAKDFPEKPVPVEQLQETVLLSKSIKQYNQNTPKEMMLIVSQALESVPEVGLQRLYWVQDTNRELEDNEITKEDSVQGSVINMPLWQMAFINAEIIAFSGDYRAAIDSTNHFVNKLKENPQVEQVVVLQEPVNISSLAKLQGSTKEAQDAARSTAVFKLKVILKQQTNLQGGL